MAMLVFCCVGTAIVGCAASKPQSPTGSYNVQVVASGAGGLTESTPLTVTIK